MQMHQEIICSLVARTPSMTSFIPSSHRISGFAATHITRLTFRSAEAVSSAIPTDMGGNNAEMDFDGTGSSILMISVNKTSDALLEQTPYPPSVYCCCLGMTLSNI